MLSDGSYILLWAIAYISGGRKERALGLFAGFGYNVPEHDTAPTHPPAHILPCPSPPGLMTEFYSVFMPTRLRCNAAKIVAGP